MVYRFSHRGSPRGVKVTVIKAGRGEDAGSPIR
jgi:hypothetical protein